jgi:hypothetical protein
MPTWALAPKMKKRSGFHLNAVSGPASRVHRWDSHQQYQQRKDRQATDQQPDIIEGSDEPGALDQ